MNIEINDNNDDNYNNDDVDNDVDKDVNDDVRNITNSTGVGDNDKRCSNNVNKGNVFQGEEKF